MGELSQYVFLAVFLRPHYDHIGMETNLLQCDKKNSISAFFPSLYVYVSSDCCGNYISDEKGYLGANPSHFCRDSVRDTKIRLFSHVQLEFMRHKSANSGSPSKLYCIKVII